MSGAWLNTALEWRLHGARKLFGCELWGFRWGLRLPKCLFRHLSNSSAILRKNVGILYLWWHFYVRIYGRSRIWVILILWLTYLMLFLFLVKLNLLYIIDDILHGLAIGASTFIIISTSILLLRLFHIRLRILIRIVCLLNICINRSTKPCAGATLLRWASLLLVE